MAVKATTPQQHNMLHQYWPNNCCLCGHEETIRQLKEQLRATDVKLERLRLEYMRASGSDSRDVNAKRQH